MRNATSIALLVASIGIAGLAPAQEATTGTADVSGSPEESSRSEDHPPRIRSPKPKPQGTSAATDLETVTVTGTRIRGGTTPSPVITIGSERIQEEGFTDLGEVIRSISQNFSGGQNPGVAAGAAQGGPGNQNITGGSSVNLRGLGGEWMIRESSLMFWLRLRLA